MDHIDIEVSEFEGSILICTDAGELIEMHVAPHADSIVSAIFSRPRASISVSGVPANDGLLETLEELGHDVRLNRVADGESAQSAARSTPGAAPGAEPAQNRAST